MTKKVIRKSKIVFGKGKIGKFFHGIWKAFRK